MKHFVLAVVLFGFAVPALARQPNSYQVTGVLSEVSDDLIVVAKGKENFEIARTADTKLTGDIQKGSKVTVRYRMTAASIEASAAKPSKNKK